MTIRDVDGLQEVEDTRQARPSGGGDHHDRDSAQLGVRDHRVVHLPARHHRHHEVEENERGALLGSQPQRDEPVLCLPDRVPGELEYVRQRLAQIVVVINDEDVSLRHGSPLYEVSNLVPTPVPAKVEEGLFERPLMADVHGRGTYALTVRTGRANAATGGSFHEQPLAPEHDLAVA